MIIILTAALKVALPFVAGAVVHALHKSSLKEILHRVHEKERNAIEQRVRNEGLRKTFLYFDDLIAYVGSEMFQSLMDALEDGHLSQEEREQLLVNFLGKLSHFFGDRVGAKVESKVRNRQASTAKPEIVLPNTGIRLDPPKLD